MTSPKAPRWATLQAFFKSSLEGNTRRALDFHEGDEIDEKTVVRAAAALNKA